MSLIIIIAATGVIIGAIAVTVSLTLMMEANYAGEYVAKQKQLADVRVCRLSLEMKTDLENWQAEGE